MKQSIVRSTSEEYSPWDLLPAPEPCTVDYEDEFFYHNVAKFLIRDTVRIMNNGLHIDLDKVTLLEEVLIKGLSDVDSILLNNPIIKEFQAMQHKQCIEQYIEDRKSKMRTAAYYRKPFNYKDMVHRSYFMYIFNSRQEKPIAQPTGLLPTGIPKWDVKTVKKLGASYPLLARYVEGKVQENHTMVIEAMDLLAEHKASMYNEKYIEQIHNPMIDVAKFNPASSKQKTELFEWLGLKSDKTSKDTKLPSWDREQIQRVNKESVNEDIIEFTQAFIDHSYAAIVKNNFIAAFYNYTIESRLHGQYKLLGAKSGRYTSSNPNMLNMPSTKSVFAGPIKACFTAPEGFIIAAIDYSALEDRVIANLSRDPNKLGLFLEGLDGHSLAATYYYPERVTSIIGEFTDNKKASRQLQAIVDDDKHPKHKEAKKVRQDSKPISFGLAYGAFPPKVAATVKIPLEEAEAIFNAYHNELYPGITRYREDYVLETAKKQGRIHLGLGFYINSDAPDKDIRTLNNATCQFWSILTALTINKIHQLIDKEGLQDDIKVTSTIYDSIYFEVRDDIEIIKWLNDTLIPIIEQDFMENQIVHNSADLEIGKDWSTLYTLPHNATNEQIISIRNEF